MPPDFAARLADLLPGHVLVVGAGGLGCPAAWGLRAGGVERITLIDPDVVELSNLPRQILFTDADLGQPKAHVAAARLGGAAAGVVGHHARLDDTNQASMLASVDVLIDATDGARTKDWLNQLAVRTNLPLVHAAALQSEARLLVVPAGGRPCLACLFGRLEEELGSCADLGVWNGVVGTAGFLAAHAAAGLLLGSVPSAATYQVFDFAEAHKFALTVPPAATCPVCAPQDPAMDLPARPVEVYPAERACGVVGAVVAEVSDRLDLRAEHCPMNLLRARKALADAGPDTVIEILLGAEGAATVPDGVRALGHEVLHEEPHGTDLLLRVRRSTGTAAGISFSGDELRRYARQLVLPDLGEVGQRRLMEHELWNAPDLPRNDVAIHYMRAAGIPGDQTAASPVRTSDVILDMARATAFADGVQRAAVIDTDDVIVMGLQDSTLPR